MDVQCTASKRLFHTVFITLENDILDTVMFHTVRKGYLIRLENAISYCYTVREVLEDFAVFD